MLIWTILLSWWDLAPSDVLWILSWKFNIWGQWSDYEKKKKNLEICQKTKFRNFFEEKKCKGTCEQKESAEIYNQRVWACINHLNNELPSFALVDYGLTHEEQSCILMEKGRFYGMGYLPADTPINTIDELKYRLTPYAENDYIRGLIYQYALRYPSKKIVLGN